MKIFVTGGLGVVGSCFCRTAIGLGHSVTVLDACAEPRNEWTAASLEPLGVKIRKERMELADLSEILEYDFILHAAAFTGIPSSSDLPDDDWVSNVDATKHLLDVLRSAVKPPPTVVLSSVKPYSIDQIPVSRELTEDGAERYSWPIGVSVNESWPLDPDEPYAASKMAQSAICVAYARTYNLPVSVFRCSNLYGPAPSHGPRHGWLTWFCISAAIGRPLIVQGDGFQSRDMLHTDDLTSAILCAYSNMEKVRGQLFNVGGGKPNVIGVAEAAGILESFGASLTRGPGRKFEDMAFVTDHSKFTSRTGWSPLKPVKQGLREVFSWALENRESLLRLYEGV